MAAKWGKRGKEVSPAVQQDSRVFGGATQVSADKPERISNKLDKILVAESAVPSRKQRAKNLLRRVKSHRRFKPAVIALVVIVVLGSLAVYLGRDKEVPIATPEGPKCTYVMLEKAKPNLTPKNVTKLEPMAWEIEKIPGYDQDVNCLYVVLTYNINMSRPEKSRELYDKLVKVYDPLEGYETVIVDVAQKPEQLKPIVEFLEQQSKVFQKIDPKTGRPKQ